jgi:endoglucanase
LSPSLVRLLGSCAWYGHAYDPITNTAGWGEWRPFDTRKTTLLTRLWGP